jgi:hypothetical protein
MPVQVEQVEDHVADGDRLHPASHVVRVLQVHSLLQALEARPT